MQADPVQAGPYQVRQSALDDEALLQEDLSHPIAQITLQFH